MRGNLGATTEAAGTASFAPGTTSVTVEHGLSGSGRVPTAEHVTVVPTGPSAAGSQFSVTGVTRTTFRIAVLTAPEAGPADFAWRVELTRR